MTTLYTIGELLSKGFWQKKGLFGDVDIFNTTKSPNLTRFVRFTCIVGDQTSTVEHTPLNVWGSNHNIDYL